MALITVLSVMNGFERELQKNILDLMPHVILSTEKGYINSDILPADKIKLEGIQRIAPLTAGEVVLQNGDNVAAGIMLGIGLAEKALLTPYLVNVSQSVLQPGEYNVILGEQIAAQLGVAVIKSAFWFRQPVGSLHSVVCLLSACLLSQEFLLPAVTLISVSCW